MSLVARRPKRYRVFAEQTCRLSHGIGDILSRISKSTRRLNFFRDEFLNRKEFSVYLGFHERLDEATRCQGNVLRRVENSQDVNLDAPRVSR